MIFGEKDSGVYNFSGEKENQRAIILVWFEVPVGYLLITMYSSNIPTYVSVFFCRVYDGVVSVPISTPKE